MSFDDGSEHDRRLVDILNRYGLRGTFHLNSGKLGREHHVGSGEVASLYAGHEVACHTVTHPYLTALPDDAIQREVSDDKKALEDLTNGPVRGLAYPFGAFDTRVVSIISGLGIEYGRTTNIVEDFGIPRDPMRMETSCHYSTALELGERFLKERRAGLGVMHAWGHSYELDGFMACDATKDWGYLESFCAFIQDHEETVWSTTAIELIDYLNVRDELRSSPRTTASHSA